jgi:hypothetical protein
MKRQDSSSLRLSDDAAVPEKPARRRQATKSLTAPRERVRSRVKKVVDVLPNVSDSDTPRKPINDAPALVVRPLTGRLHGALMQPPEAEGKVISAHPVSNTAPSDGRGRLLWIGVGTSMVVVIAVWVWTLPYSLKPVETVTPPEVAATSESLTALYDEVSEALDKLNQVPQQTATPPVAEPKLSPEEAAALQKEVQEILEETRQSGAATGGAEPQKDVQ